MTTFRAGLHAERAEFRHMDAQGRPVDPTTETPTQRAERIEELQRQRLAAGPRDAPPSDAASVLREWMAQSAANRMSAFARNVAENPGGMPQAETFTETSTPQPGGLLERMAARRHARGSAA